MVMVVKDGPGRSKQYFFDTPALEGVAAARTGTGRSPPRGPGMDPAMLFEDRIPEKIEE